MPVQASIDEYESESNCDPLVPQNRCAEQSPKSGMIRFSASFLAIKFATARAVPRVLMPQLLEAKDTCQLAKNGLHKTHWSSDIVVLVDCDFCLASEKFSVSSVTHASIEDRQRASR